MLLKTLKKFPIVGKFGNGFKNLKKFLIFGKFGNAFKNFEKISNRR
jgi:hypothetical protein